MAKEEKETRIAKLKRDMAFEEINNFPNGDLWNTLADELYELTKIPSIFELVSAILNSNKKIMGIV